MLVLNRDRLLLLTNLTVGKNKNSVCMSCYVVLSNADFIWITSLHKCWLRFMNAWEMWREWVTVETPYMSVKQYETYLAETFIEWVSSIIQPGERYQFKSPDPDNALKLWKAFDSLANGNKLEIAPEQFLPTSNVIISSLFRYCTAPLPLHSQKTIFLIYAIRFLAAMAFCPDSVVDYPQQHAGYLTQ